MQYSKQQPVERKKTKASLTHKKESPVLVCSAKNNQKMKLANVCGCDKLPNNRRKLLASWVIKIERMETQKRWLLQLSLTCLM